MEMTVQSQSQSMRKINMEDEKFNILTHQIIAG